MKCVIHEIDDCGQCKLDAERLRDALNESPSASAEYVAVPVRELIKLEQSRKDIYKHLGEHVGTVMLHNLTEQMWKVANTKKWK
jgi:hypothetical protein